MRNLAERNQSLERMIRQFSKPPKRPRCFKRVRAWWALLMLRRDFAKQGVQTWRLTDEEFKEQLREGMRKCVELMRADLRSL